MSVPTIAPPQRPFYLIESRPGSFCRSCLSRQQIISPRLLDQGLTRLGVERESYSSETIAGQCPISPGREFVGLCRWLGLRCAFLVLHSAMH
jgi:hypothetical protein